MYKTTLIFYLNAFVFWFFQAGAAGLDMRTYLLSAEQETSELVRDIEIPREHTIFNWFEEPEVRISINDDDEQVYGFRVRPRFSAEGRIERTVHELKIQQHRLLRKSLLNEALKRRYMMLIEIIAQQEQIELLGQEADLLNTKIKLLKQLVQTKSFDPEQLEIAEYEFSEVENIKTLNSRQLMKRTAQIGFDEAKISSILSSRSNWLVSLSELKDNIGGGTTQSEGIDSNFRIQMLSTNLLLAQQDFELARKKKSSMAKVLRSSIRRPDEEYF